MKEMSALVMEIVKLSSIITRNLTLKFEKKPVNDQRRRAA